MKLLRHILILLFIFSVNFLFCQEFLPYKKFKHPNKGNFIFSGKYCKATINSEDKFEYERFFSGNRVYRIIIDREYNDQKLVLIFEDSKSRTFHKRTISKKTDVFDFEIDGAEKVKLKLVHEGKTKVSENLNMYIGFKAYNSRYLFSNLSNL